jgi:hypothetical protein
LADTPTESLRQRVLKRKAAMWTERSTWFDHWREISELQQPRLGRFFVSDTNKGQKRYQSIVDNTALFASRTLAAGMMSGMTSPARPWFRLGLSDKELMESGAVKSWLYQVSNIMRSVFSHSNVYRSLHMIYEELGLFGTAACVVLPDYDNVIHCYPLTVGEYAIGIDHRGRVNALCREFMMTVGQLVEQFGRDNCSTSVQDAFDRNDVDRQVPVIHLIEPRRNRDTTKKDARSMRFASVYIESGAPDDKVLSESGFKRFLVLAPRWSVTGNDTYGSSPGMEALGDVKQLQHQQRRKAQGIDYQTNPPIQVPVSYKDAMRSRLPGGVMFVDQSTPGGGVRSAFDIQLNLSHLLLDIQDVRERIKTAYYADLFMMLANDTRSGITATEVAERHEEKLLMLGPVLERLQNELLQPLIDLTFDLCMEAGILPPPPPELEGLDLSVEFVSTLAQAQRVISAQGTDRLIGTIASLAQMYPQAVDKIDFDQVIDDYGDMYGVNPEIILADDQVAAIREAKAKQAAAAQAAANAPVMADTAKTLGDTNGANVQQVMQQFQGYNTGAPGVA